MADAEWEPHRAEIERFYIVKNKTLKELMTFMSSTHNFSKSKAQYEGQFKKWGLKKRQMTSKDWTVVRRKIDKRQREEGKESDVFINGVRYPPEKVRKEIFRPNSFISTWEMHAGSIPQTPQGITVSTPAPSMHAIGSVPQTPEGMTVSSPAAPSMQPVGNTPRPPGGMAVPSPGVPRIQAVQEPSLPWLQFRQRLRSGDLRLGVSDDDMLTSKPSGMVSPTLNGTSERVMEFLVNLVPWKQRNVETRSRLENILTVLVPEEYATQHQENSTALSNSYDLGLGSIELQLFLLAEGVKFTSSHMMMLFKSSGLGKPHRFRALVVLPDITASAIAEKFFQFALTMRDLKVVEMMLEAGMDPNLLITDPLTGKAVSPIEYAADIIDEELSIQMVKLLMSHGADLKNPPRYENALINDRINEPVLRNLLTDGGIPTPDLLARMIPISKWNSQTIRILIEAGVDINSTSKLSGRTMVGVAIESRNVRAVEILQKKGARMDILEKISFEDQHAVTTLFGLAIHYGWDFDDVVWLAGCDNGLRPDPGPLPYVPPLLLAIKRGDWKMVRYIFNESANLHLPFSIGRKTILEGVANSEDLEWWNTLQNVGFELDFCGPPSPGDPSMLLMAVRNNNKHAVQTLLESGVQVDEISGDPPETALGAAIQTGNMDIITELHEAGAKVPGPEVRRIGTFQAAVYLRDLGMLERILEAHGEEILVHAIEKHHSRLVELLLEQNADRRRETRTASDKLPSPLEAALDSFNVSLADLLIERGASITEFDVCAAVWKGGLLDFQLLHKVLSKFQGNAPTAMLMALVLKSSIGIHSLLDAGIGAVGHPAYPWEGGVGDDDDKKFELRSKDGYWWRGEASGECESVLRFAVRLGSQFDIQALLRLNPWTPTTIGQALTQKILDSDPDKCSEEDLEIIEDLMNAGPDINCTMMMPYSHKPGKTVGYTPLQCAVSRQFPMLASTLIARGADVNYLGKGYMRWSALQEAVLKANVELIYMLLESGCDVNGPASEDGGHTALQLAAMRGYLGIANLLLEKGAEVNAPGAELNGRTALEYAAKHGRINMIQLLLNHGALVTGSGEQQYNRAVELAEKNAHHAAVRLLKSYKQQVEGVNSNR